MTQQPALHPAVDSDETLQNSAQTRAFFGNVSEMWIARRLQEARRLAENPKEGCIPFPLPIEIAGRNYWRTGELREYRDAHFRALEGRAPPRTKRGPPPPRPRKTESAR
jgi:hypothetical protein